MPDLTITLTAEHVARVQTAFGNKLGLPGDATAEDVRQELIAYLKNTTRSYETGVANEAASAAVTDIEPT